MHAAPTIAKATMLTALLTSVAAQQHTTPLGWVKHTMPVPHTEAVSFSVCLKERNRQKLFQAALDVSTPGHVSYGKFLSVDDIEELTRPASSDVDAVTQWLVENRVTYTQARECYQVQTTVGTASSMLSTSFDLYYRAADGRLKTRAGAYTLPPRVEQAVESIFGLHGVPLPPLPVLASPNPVPQSAAKVTPTVIAQTYKVGAASVDRGGKNSQAVAEFQGQNMNKTDLATFFKHEVPTAQPGDEKVAKFVGVPYKEGSGVEAALDIQFMMGLAPGVHTEFWEWPDMDFCADLANFTNHLLMPDGPIVMSISYGWQGNMSQVGCHDADLKKVDANWAKLAAAGVSVFISSGDSGSQCKSSGCEPGSFKHDQKVDGEVDRHENARLAECCEMAAHSHGAQGFTWTPPSAKDEAMMSLRSASEGRRAEAIAEARRLVAATSTTSVVEEGGAAAAAAPAPPSPFVFDKTLFHVQISLDENLPQRDVHILDGTLPPSGGDISIHNANGTFADTKITFGEAPSHKGPVLQREISMTIKGKTYKGRADFFAFGGPLKCEQLIWEHAEGGGSSRNLLAIVDHGPNPPPPPPKGNCTIYSSVSGLVPASGSVSGGSGVTPEHVVLFPSWPASSPWVTAVGATRFLNHTVGHEEMASDQFGSGGGFSTMWTTDDAPYQKDAVAKYVAMGPTLPKFPPAGSFPATGRGTPDVAALGEGYQVWEHGKVQSVGGTSASSPAFAGMVSLINEARFKAGKPQMGFINPFLYKNPDAFFDVVTGTNAIGRGTGPLKFGYAAAPGWDAATGLGTPLYDKLLAAALAA